MSINFLLILTLGKLMFLISFHPHHLKLIMLPRSLSWLSLTHLLSYSIQWVPPPPTRPPKMVKQSPSQVSLSPNWPPILRNLQASSIKRNLHSPFTISNTSSQCMPNTEISSAHSKYLTKYPNEIKSSEFHNHRTFKCPIKK